MNRSEAVELHLGVDVGGTFTDLVAAGAGKIRLGKVPTRVGEPFEAIVEGLTQMGLGVKDISTISFGTTIATNILIERTGAKIALLCTEGFTDVLDHQRWHRRYLYDLQQTRPEPLVPRSRRVGLRERVLSDGTVLLEVDPEQVTYVVSALRDEGVESIAICLLNSYANPANEKVIEDTIKSLDLDVFTSTSTAISPLIREWERTSTTVINAYVQPAMDSHLAELGEKTSEQSSDLRLHVMQSSGGVISAAQAASEPVRTILSGPAAGVIGGIAVGAAADRSNLILMDMGGTSCDVSVVIDGSVHLSKEGEADYNLPVSVPMLDINTIGAGGGSLVSIDTGRALKVGPASAGAVPGPACYGRGGSEPTVTDAQLLLGRLPASGLLSGQMSLDTQASEQALAPIAEELGMSAEALAAGAIRIANANMAEAIRMITVNRGLDPREFSLLAFGGAGPLHACEIADELDIEEVLIPASAGVLSASGLASAAVQVSVINPLNIGLDELNDDFLNDQYLALEGRATGKLDEHGVDEAGRAIYRRADVRYRHQSFEVSVPYEGETVQGLVEAFHDAHQSQYHYSREEEVPFLVNIEVHAEGPRRDPAIPDLETGAGPAAPSGARLVYTLGNSEWAEAAIFSRDELRAGDRLAGPAVIEQLDSTVVVPPGFDLTVDDHGTLIMTRKEDGNEH